MQYLNILLASAGSVIVLFILTKLMGNRQMSQLSMFDYIIGITIGSIAAEMATSLESDFLKPLIAMVVYALFSIGFSIITSKSLRLRRYLTGETLVLFEDGKLFRGNLKKAHLDLTEFLSQCRNSGYFNLADLQSAILEHNGKMSFLPKSQKRPVTPSDLNINTSLEKPLLNIILDGELLKDNLKFTGNNKTWLDKELHAQGIKKMEDVFLATCDCDNNLSVYVKINQPMTRDMFE